MKFSRIALLNLGLIASTNIFAAELVSLKNEKSVEIQTLVNASAQSSVAAASQNKNARTAQNSYQLIQLQQNHFKKVNVTHTRYQQTYNGLPIFGYHVIAHQKKGTAPEFSGVMVKQIEKDLGNRKRAVSFNPQPTLQKKKADYLTAHPQANIAAASIINKAIIFIDENKHAHEAYHVSFFANDTANGIFERPNWIIDANTGAQLKAWNGLTTKANSDSALPSIKYWPKGKGPGGNEKTGRYNYGIGYLPSLTFAYESNGDESVCYLYSKDVKVVDFKSGWGWGDEEQPPVIPKWDCNLKNAAHRGDDAINGAASPANDALAFGTYVAAGFDAWGLSPVAARKVVLNVHVGEEFSNAFWDGFSVNFGDGNDEFYPFVSIEIVAHEIGHGFTEANSGLVYYGQSGGLNESFSDIMGKYFEVSFNQRYLNKRTIDWRVGADIAKDENNVIRYFDQPSKDKSEYSSSIDHISEYTDDLDPHQSSGLFNRLFYLIANDERMNAFNPEGLENSAALFVYANITWWYPTINFNDAASGLMHSAQEFQESINNYMETPYVDIVHDALAEIGIYCEGGTCSQDEDDWGKNS